MTLDKSNNISWKYQCFTPSCCKDIDKYIWACGKDSIPFYKPLEFVTSFAAQTDNGFTLSLFSLATELQILQPSRNWNLRTIQVHGSRKFWLLLRARFKSKSGMCSCVYYFEGAKTPLPLNEFRLLGFGIRCEKSHLDLDFTPPPFFISYNYSPTGYIY